MIFTDDRDFERDILDHTAYERELAADELEYQATVHHERLHRDDPAAAWCAVCNCSRGLSIYGWKCQGCHEAQREERDAR